MQTLIDKIQLAGTANIETAGFKTLLVVINNGTSEAPNYTGSKAEADALKAQITVNMKDKTTDDAVALDGQYIKVRTIAGTTKAIMEVVLTKALVASIALPANYTSVINMLTLPANSIV